MPLLDQKKLKIAALAGLVFLVVSAPYTYKLVNSLTSKVGLKVALPDGCATTQGLIVHTVVFILVTYLVMKVPAVQRM